MAWRLKGSYAETCSCELMCPCNLSFDHGATYDFCRATLAFNIREGDIDDSFNAVILQGGNYNVTTGGRFILSSLEQNSSGGQWIHWQRCIGTGAPRPGRLRVVCVAAAGSGNIIPPARSRLPVTAPRT